jgi:hypothetical protein
VNQISGCELPVEDNLKVIRQTKINELPTLDLERSNDFKLLDQLFCKSKFLCLYWKKENLQEIENLR